MDAAELVEIREFIAQLLAERDDHAPFSDEESLMLSGRLDSLAVVKIVLFLESAFAIDFTRIEFDPQRFESVAELSVLVEESRAAG